MTHISNILAVCGLHVGCEETLLCAQNLARQCRARLTIAEVVERLPGDSVVRFLPPLPEDMDGRARLVAECRSRLDRIADSLRGDGLDVDSMLLTGKPVTEIVRAVLVNGFDTILIAGDTPRVRRFPRFSAVSTSLLRRCPCPVWIVRPGSGERVKRILVAIDPPRVDSPDDRLDVRMVDLARTLARANGARLDIFNAWRLPPDDAAISDSEVSDEMRRALAGKSRASSQMAVQRVLEQVQLDGVSHNLVCRKGNPVTAIAEHVEESDTDLVVMGVESRVGINRWLLGSTAEDVLRRVGCSVLTVKPDGFQARTAMVPTGEQALVSSGR